MSIPGSATPLLLATTAAAEADFKISRSLRFTSGDSSYLSRTPSSAGNRKTWTWSGWIKRGDLTSGSPYGTVFFSADTGNAPWTAFQFESSDGTLQITTFAGSSTGLKTNAQFRDPSAWYHLVIAFDTTQSTASDRVKCYVNGVAQTFSNTNYPAQNSDTKANGTFPQYIGFTNNQYFDGYLADVYLIDGQQLAPTDFGETDSDNNWNPKEYSGTYGTNGFHLDFSDTSDLGADAAGSNDWTPNNLVGSAPGLSTANQGFDAVTYSGNGSTQSISGLNFQPDFVWLKETGPRTNVSHQLYDVVRGTSKMLQSDNTGTEATVSGVTGFTSNGFNLGSNGGGNNSGSNYVAWCWKAGGTASSNTNGTITSSVSANTTYGFSVVTYTGTGSAGATVGHGLGSVPKFMLVKNRSSADIMVAYHESVGNTGALRLTTAATDTGYNWWNSTTPSSSVFTIGNTGATNNSSNNYVAYCWSEVSGFSKFGSYSGNGQTLGPKVTTNFKPRLVAIKRTDSAGNWTVYDSARSLNNDLKWNTHEAEGTAPIIFHSDGFQTNYATGSLNASGGSYVYMAFASKPDGSIIDSLIDTPTNYDADSGNNGGNYATLNPLSKGSAITLANGNLDISAASSGSQRVWGTIGVSTGKWYFEFTQNSGTYAQGVGIKSSAAQDNNTNYFYTGHTGQKVNASGTASSYGATWGNNDVIGVAFDLDAGTITFYKNGTSQGQAFSGITDATYFPYVVGWSGGAWGGTVNFGQRPFAYTPPTGYKSLCTQNLPDPTIAKGSDYFDVKLYTGTGSDQAITGLDFNPDWVWIKTRNEAENHFIVDSVRGVTKQLYANLTSQEYTNSNRFKSFDSNGFTVGTTDDTNQNNNTFVAWAWDAGTSTVSNTDGSQTTNARANQSAGFSICTYSGGGSGTANSDSGDSFGHGLNTAPDLVICKKRSGVNGWPVYHSATALGALNLASSGALDTGSYLFAQKHPTNSVVYLGNNPEINATGHTYVAYCFTAVAGYSAFGSYTGNGSTDGPFVFTGFRPAFVLTKASSAGGNWQIIDSTRSDFNLANDKLWPSQAYQENSATLGGASADNIDILSNGFKLKTSNAGTNGSGVTYVYAAFASHSVKTARAR